MMDFAFIFTAVLFGIVLISVLRGLFTGSGSQIVSLCLTAIAAIAAFLITLAIEDNLIAAATPDKIKEYILGMGEQVAALNIAEIANYLNSLDLLVALVGAFVSPIVFASIFLTLNGVLGAFSTRISRLIGLGNNAFAGGVDVFGAALGVLNGLIVAFVLCVPVSGMVGMVDESIEIVRAKNDEKYSSIINTYDESIASINDHFAVAAVRELGADSMMDSFTTVMIDGNEINLRSEFVNVVSIVVEFASIGEVDFTALSEENKLSISSAVDALEDSDYLMMLASGIISDMGHALEDGIIPIKVPSPYDVVLNPAISMLATSNIDNFKADLDTILEIYYLLSDSGALKAFGQKGHEQEMTDAFTLTDTSGDTIINRVVAIIDKNEHMRPLVKALADMSLIMLTNQLGIDANIVEVYDNIKTGVNDVLAVNPDDYDTNEEYVAARNEKLDEAFSSNGVELEPEVIDGIGDYIDENYPDLEELTDDDINDIILSYYDVYMSVQSEGINP